MNASFTSTLFYHYADNIRLSRHRDLRSTQNARCKQFPVSWFQFRHGYSYCLSLAYKTSLPSKRRPTKITSKENSVLKHDGEFYLMLIHGGSACFSVVKADSTTTCNNKITRLLTNLDQSRTSLCLPQPSDVQGLRCFFQIFFFKCLTIITHPVWCLKIQIIFGNLPDIF